MTTSPCDLKHYYSGLTLSGFASRISRTSCRLPFDDAFTNLSPGSPPLIAAPRSNILRRSNWSAVDTNHKWQLWLTFSIEMWRWTYHFQEVRIAKLGHKKQQPFLYIGFLPGDDGEVSPCRAVASPPDMSSSAAGLNSHRSVPTMTTTSPSPSTSRIFPCFPKAWETQVSYYYFNS